MSQRLSAQGQARVRFLRAAGELVLNYLLATYVASWIGDPLWKYLHSASASQLVWKECIICALAGFGVGCSVYRIGHQAAARWVWLPGLCLLLWRAVTLWLEEHRMLFGSPHTVFGQMSGADCSAGFAQSCQDFIGYTAPFVRTIFYSAGAWCCSRIELARSSPHSRAGL
jgi:hypothetical protein